MAAKTPGDSGKTPELAPQPHGGAIRVGGNPGNKGGGRRPKSFSTFLAGLREDETVQAAIEKAAKDTESRGFAPVLKVMSDYDKEKPGQKLEHRFPDLPRDEAAGRIAAILNEARQRKASNGNGAHANGNGTS